MARKPQGPRLLKKWLKSAGWSQTDLAHELDCDRSLVCRWLKKDDDRRPTFDQAFLLEDLTGKAVPARSWAV